MIVVTNAIYCLKNSLSSANFVRLNEKDDLLSTGPRQKTMVPRGFFIIVMLRMINCERT